jgi:hypothetical protein
MSQALVKQQHKAVYAVTLHKQLSFLRELTFFNYITIMAHNWITRPIKNGTSFYVSPAATWSLTVSMQTRMREGPCTWLSIYEATHLISPSPLSLHEAAWRAVLHRAVIHRGLHPSTLMRHQSVGKDLHRTSWLTGPRLHRGCFQFRMFSFCTFPTDIRVAGRA